MHLEFKINFLLKKKLYLQIHIHAPFDIPFINADKNLKETILWGSVKEIYFSVRNFKFVFYIYIHHVYHA